MYRFVFLYSFSIADYLKFTMKSEVNLVFLTIIRKILCSQKQKTSNPLPDNQKHLWDEYAPQVFFYGSLF